MKKKFPYTLNELQELQRKRYKDGCLDGGYFRCKYKDRIANWKDSDTEELIEEYTYLFGHAPMENGNQVTDRQRAATIAFFAMKDL